MGARAALGVTTAVMPPGPSPEMVKAQFAKAGLELAGMEKLAARYHAEMRPDETRSIDLAQTHPNQHNQKGKDL